MLNRFRHTVEELRGLIGDLRSASVSMDQGGSLGCRKDKYLLAVSGGIDSMCLADLWLRCFGPESFSIAHCNFHLRGEESDGDETLVTRWAEENGVRMHRVDFDTVRYASENSLSIEMAARELRYTWFGELCEEHGYGAVVVAHHADDNAETLVLNMVRGAGLKGLTGMKPISPLSTEPSSLVLRPLLTFTRKQIEGHVFAWKVPYREDSTNTSVEYRRNSIRHEVFPLFERMNPSYVRTLNREMTYLSDASSIVEEWCKERLPHVLAPLSFRPNPQLSFRPSPQLSFRPSEASGEISITIPRLLETLQWRYLLYYILEPYGFNASTLESLENLLVSDRTASGKRFESRTHVLLVERDSLIVRPISVPDLSGDPFAVIRGAGVYHINGSRISIEVLARTPDMPLRQPEGTIVLDAGKLAFPFVCRKWRNGDWMIPLGMRGKKKLSDMFTDLKYGSIEKDASLVIVDCKGDRAERQQVAALVGMRIDDHYKVTESTVDIIKIKLLND